MASLFNAVKKFKTGPEFTRKELMKNSIDWFRKNVIKQKQYSQIITKDGSRIRFKAQPGQMYYSRYIAKHKKTLPYWDTNPLFFIIKVYQDRFLVLNFHYLPYEYRAILLDDLMAFATNTRLSEKNKMNLKYDYITSFAELAVAKPCLKYHLFKQYRSSFKLIYPDEWGIAIFLPNSNFNATLTRVYVDSMDIIRRARSSRKD